MTGGSVSGNVYSLCYNKVLTWKSSTLHYRCSELHILLGDSVVNGNGLQIQRLNGKRQVGGGDCVNSMHRTLNEECVFVVLHFFLFTFSCIFSQCIILIYYLIKEILSFHFFFCSYFHVYLDVLFIYFFTHLLNFPCTSISLSGRSDCAAFYILGLVKGEYSP